MPVVGNYPALLPYKLGEGATIMQSHDGDHEKQGEHEGGKQQQHEEDTLDLDGGEPSPRVAASVPSGGATEHKVRAADTRGRDLGNFLLTHYTFALESDPTPLPTP